MHEDKCFHRHLMPSFSLWKQRAAGSGKHKAGLHTYTPVPTPPPPCEIPPRPSQITLPPLAGSHPSPRARLPLALTLAQFSVEMRRGPNGLSGAVMICKVSGDGGLTAGSKHRKPMNPPSVWARTHSSAGRAARRCDERTALYMLCGSAARCSKCISTDTGSI